MSKLNLANLAQNEVTKDEAQKTKGGVFCYCDCYCVCSYEYRIEYRIDERISERTWVLENS